MPQNSFRNIGLRRDKNFSDLENRETGLTNLLNDFPSGTDTYIGDDLNEAIKSIRSYPVTKIEINRLAGITFKNTVYNTITEESVTAPAVPLVTIKNQFDRVKLELGEESYFGGNVNGINAKFYNTSQINAPASGTPTSANIFTGSPVIEKPFWMDGKTVFPNKFNSALNNQQGGVQWDGFFMPEANGSLNIRIESSCNLLLDIRGNIVSHLANATHTVGIIFDNNINGWVLNNYNDHIFIAEGCVVANSNNAVQISTISLFPATGQCILTFNGTLSESGTFTVYTRYQQLVIGSSYSFSPIGNDTEYPDAFGDSPVGNVTYVEPGANLFTLKTILTGVEEYIPIAFTASTWLPENHEAKYKEIQFTFTMQLGTVNSSAYPNFSNTIPSTDPADFPEFKKFYANRLLQGGGAIGSPSDPQFIKTNKSITATDYVPPLWANIVNKGQSPKLIKPIIGSALAEEVLNDSPLYAEIGNIFLNDGGNSTASITKVIPGIGLVFDSVPTFPSPEGINIYPYLNLIDHRGFVKAASVWSYVGTTVTIDSTNKLIPGMMFIYNGGKEEITKINNATSFEIASTVTNTDAINDSAYVYQDAGILNYTTYNIVSVTDTSTLVLDTVFGIQPGYYIKSIGKAGTEHLQEVDTVNSTTNTITTVSPTTGDILAGDKIIAERANVNTAPPFIATLSGLSTNNANIKLTNANGLVRALDIEVKNYIDVTTEFTAAQDRNYYRLIDITVNDSNVQQSIPYKIIATSFSNPEP